MSHDDALLALGWNARLAVTVPASLRAARVIAEHRGRFELAGVGAPSALAEPTGRLRGAAATRLELPVVGDWVAVDESCRIEMILPRASLLVRKEAGRGSEAQPLAANVERAWIVTAPDGDFSPRRVERFLAVAWEGGAVPEIVLAKADLVADALPFLDELARVAPGVIVRAASVVSGQGIEELAGALGRGETVALLGSSGVGKSSLVNALAGAAVQATSAVRDGDHKGRHTTTGRRLVALPGGGLVIDTPGMRELGIAGGDDGLGVAFADIEELAAGCRFRDCAHASEPGCAVRGEVEADRLEAFRALVAEQARAEEAAQRKQARLEQRKRR